jgi:heme/copper-type cytochrome/quinol oxidase subunit 3
MLKQSLKMAPARKEHYQSKLVFLLFLVSLGMFFVASLITYLMVRDQAFNPIPNAIPGSFLDQGPEIYQPLKIPGSFWLSTVALILVSFFLHRACWLVHRERQKEFRILLGLAWLAAFTFTLVQGFGMAWLLNQHFSVTDGSMKIFGMSFTLALIHALHVMGGMAFLGFVIYQAYRDRYDHERHFAVDNCANYWHFLDVVWVCMLVVFLIAR